MVDVEAVRKETMEALGLIDEADVAYIDEELLRTYENQSVDLAESEGHEALEPPGDAPAFEWPEKMSTNVPWPRYHVYYGNHLVSGAGGKKGRLDFSNGTHKYPNDPCGQLYRWTIQQMPVGTQLNPFRGCGTFTGYQIALF
jgi:hypothetical protein